MPDTPKPPATQAPATDKVTSAPSWRDVLPIHPAANLLPLLTPDELKALGEDIKKNGMREPVTLWSPGSNRNDKDECRTPDEVYLLDGRNRLDACEMVGLTIEIHQQGHHHQVEIPSLGDDFFSDHRLETFVDWAGNRSPDILDPYAYVVSANIHRRHLTADQRRDLIAKLIKATPEKSDRQIAETTKASPTTVGKVRAEMEAKGDVSRMDTRTDTKGRKQPKKKRRTADDFVADMKANKPAEQQNPTPAPTTAKPEASFEWRIDLEFRAEEAVEFAAKIENAWPSDCEVDAHLVRTVKQAAVVWARLAERVKAMACTTSSGGLQ